MGYSYRNDACRTLDRITDFLQKSGDDGKGNVFFVNGEKYFWEEFRKDQPDGGIKGEVWKFIDAERIVKAGNFSINGSGTIAKFPPLSKKQIAPLLNKDPFEGASLQGRGNVSLEGLFWGK